MSSAQFRLPYFLATWPYERHVNPRCAEVSDESSAWIASYNILNPKSMRAFQLCNSGLLAALAYPYVSKAQLRSVCDGLNLVFLFDDFSDVQDHCQVRRLADVMLEALRHPHSPPKDLTSVFEDLTRSFWLRALETLSPSCTHRFIEAFDQYTAAIVQQAKDRDVGRVRDMESYLALRRDTIGAKLAFALLEPDYNFPHDVLNDPMITELTDIAIDIISLCNDAYSWNVEQARGDEAHNMVTCIMCARQLELEGAMTVLETSIRTLADRFLDTRGKVRKRTDEIDAHVAAYIDGLGIWVRANDSWSFESQRYFGSHGKEVQKTRIVELRPRRRG